MPFLDPPSDTNPTHADESTNQNRNESRFSELDPAPPFPTRELQELHDLFGGSWMRPRSSNTDNPPSGVVDPDEGTRYAHSRTEDGPVGRVRGHTRSSVTDHRSDAERGRRRTRRQFTTLPSSHGEASISFARDQNRGTGFELYLIIPLRGNASQRVYFSVEDPTHRGEDEWLASIANDSPEITGRTEEVSNDEGDVEDPGSRCVERGLRRFWKYINENESGNH